MFLVVFVNFHVSSKANILKSLPQCGNARLQVKVALLVNVERSFLIIDALL